ncbi:MAG: hypothetical protein P8X89_21030 [Reinekea sp.]
MGVGLSVSCAIHHTVMAPMGVQDISASQTHFTYLSPESVTPQRRSAQAIDSSLLAKNWGEPMGAPAIFEQQIEIKLLHSASTEGVTDSGFTLHISACSNR